MSDDEESMKQRLSGKPIDKTAKRETLMKIIRQDYCSQKGSSVVKVIVKNIVIIGRSRTGKSTIKSMLVNPTDVPTDLTLMSGTRDPSVESFFIADKNMLLNIIDTPGVYEHHNQEALLRDNETIMKAIETCINLEITKFHLICFAFSMPAGIQSDDIDALKLFIGHLGPELSRNSCLIITRAESKTEEQRIKLEQELLNDSLFKQVSSYFKRGIFFTGSLNYDDYLNANSSILDQYKNVIEYRTALLNEFAMNCEAFQINQSFIGEVYRLKEEYERKSKALEAKLSQASQNDQNRRDFEKIQKEKLMKDMEEERKRFAAQNKGCSIS